MARFKPIHKGLKLLPVDFDRQVIPGSFEYALCHLVDQELDLSAFHARYKNDIEGASAFDPAVLIKIILLAYSRGIIHSRATHGVSSNIPTNSITLHRWLDPLDWNFRVPFITSSRAGIVGKIFF